MPDELNVTLEDDSPVIEVQIIGTGPVGPTGGPGPAGPEGPAGSDGVSPEVTITTITGGHRVIITDAEHPTGQSFDVMDGESGGTELFWVEYGTTTNAEIETARLAGKVCVCEYNSKIYFLATISENGTNHIFATTNMNTAYRVQCLRDVWSNTSKLIPSAYSSDPEPLGTASAGSASTFARGNHVHPMPSAADVGAAPAVTEVTVSTAGAVTQALDAGKIYHFTGAVSSLTLTFNAAATGQIAQYHFDFDSGSTAPTVTLPATVTMQGGTFTPEASKHYEVDILNGYGVSMAW